MRQTTSVLYIAIDALFLPRGNAISGFDEFIAALDHAGIPSVWLTSRTRLQVDEPRRKLAHAHPFIAEEGCGVFLPEDYFHLRPQISDSRPGKSSTVRLGRFTCLPIAEQQPAASDALDALSSETGVQVVPLRSLSPRELAQNSGLPPREAELARQRDFDELFFFAGGSPQEIERFAAGARSRKWQVRQRGALWSLAIGASTPRCIRELSNLYDRALHAHARTIGIAVQGHESDFFQVCDRAILLTNAAESKSDLPGGRSRRVIELPLRSSDTWHRLLASLKSH